MKRNVFAAGIAYLLLAMAVVPAMGTYHSQSYSTTESEPVPQLSNNGDVLYVGGSGPSNYSKIQDAIDSASDGDTIFVYDDSSPYRENVIIDKSIMLIGEDRKTTIIDGGKIGDVIKITAEKVSISNFTIRNCGKYDAGIEIISSNNIIANCILYKNPDGICLNSSNDNIVENNSISCSGVWSGIDLWNSMNNIIQNNRIFNNSYSGIHLGVSSHNIIQNNTISSNKWFGIGLNLFWGVSKNFNADDGKRGSSYNIIRCNNILNNKNGIFIMDSFFNSDNNIIYNNNFIENDRQAEDYCKNSWDKGYQIGGNYWSDYTGVDRDGDGIGDTPYNISGGNNQDRYPLMKPFGINQNLIIEIYGGFGITIIVKNIGETDLSNLEWSIATSGIIFLLENKEGVITSLPAGEEVYLYRGFVFGVGPVKITVTVGDISITANFWLFGPLIFVE